MRRSVHAVALAALAVTCVDCVPADAPTEVYGSLAIDLGVADAAHAPAALTDGWSFRFERVLLSAYVSTSGGTEGCSGVTDDDNVLFDALTPFTFRVNRLTKARCAIGVNLVGVHRYEDEYSTVLGPGATPDDRASFYNPETQTGKSMLLEGTATRGASTKKLSLRMGEDEVIPMWLSLECGEEDVIPDERHTYRVRFDPTRIFADALEGGNLRFDPFADADKDNDGTVTFDEIALVDVGSLRAKLGGYAGNARKLAQYVISLVRRSWVLEADPSVDCKASGVVSWE